MILSTKKTIFHMPNVMGDYYITLMFMWRGSLDLKKQTFIHQMLLGGHERVLAGGCDQELYGEVSVLLIECV
jgi:hypothetical protein